MTKPQLHRHLTTGIFNQLSKILKKLRLSDFFLDRAAGKFQQVLELCALSVRKFRVSAMLSVFSATKPDYQVSSCLVNNRRTTCSNRLASCCEQPFQLPLCPPLNFTATIFIVLPGIPFQDFPRRTGSSLLSRMDGSQEQTPYFRLICSRVCRCLDGACGNVLAQR